MESDTIAIAGLVVGAVSFLATLVTVKYAKNAADVGREAYMLAKKQAESGPTFDISLDGDEPLVINRPAPPKPKPKPEATGKSVAELGSIDWSSILNKPGALPYFGVSEGEEPHGVIPLQIFNTGDKPANAVHGWLTFSPAFLKPFDSSLPARVGKRSYWVTTDDEYEVQVTVDKITPSTGCTFEIPVKALELGQCAVTYRFVCDEDVEVEGSIIVQIRETESDEEA